MSGGFGGTTSNGLRLLGSGLVDANNAAGVSLGVLAQDAKIQSVQVVRRSGGALTIATVNIGDNASTFNNIINSQILSGLGTAIGVSLSLPMTGLVDMLAGTELFAKMGVLAGSASSFDVRVWGSYPS